MGPERVFLIVHLFVPVLCVYKDVVFVLDKSSSLNIADFDESVHFTHDVIQSLQIGTSDVLASLVTFSTGQTEEFDLKDYTEKSEMLRAVDSLLGTNTSGDGDIKGSLEFVLDNTFQTSTRTSPAADRAVILVTSSLSSDSAESVAIADRIRTDFGADIFTIGVGSTVYTHNAELRGVANDPDANFTVFVDNFSDLWCAVPVIVEKIDPLSSLTPYTNCTLKSLPPITTHTTENVPSTTTTESTTTTPLTTSQSTASTTTQATTTESTSTTPITTSTTSQSTAATTTESTTTTPITTSKSTAPTTTQSTTTTSITTSQSTAPATTKSSISTTHTTQSTIVTTTTTPPPPTISSSTSPPSSQEISTTSSMTSTTTTDQHPTITQQTSTTLSVLGPAQSAASTSSSSTSIVAGVVIGILAAAAAVFALIAILRRRRSADEDELPILILVRQYKSAPMGPSKPNFSHQYHRF